MEDESTYSKYVSSYASDSEFDSDNNTNVIRAYAQIQQVSDTNDGVVSLPDQENIDLSVKEFLGNDDEEKKNKASSSKDKIL